MPKAERVIGGGADCEAGAGRGPASESSESVGLTVMRVRDLCALTTSDL